MDHLTSAAIERVLRGRAIEPELRSAIAHLPGCKQCWAQAAALRDETGTRIVEGDAGLLVRLLARQEEAICARQIAFAKWTVLEGLSLSRIEDQLRKVEALRDPQVAEAGVEQAENQPIARTAEHLASAAEMVLKHVPEGKCCNRTRSSLLARARIVRANSRRRLGNWSSSAQLLTESAELADQDPVVKVRLLAVKSSLAFDLGELEECLRCLASAELLVREHGNKDDLGRLQIEQASVLHASRRPIEALELLRQAELTLPESDSRFWTLLRFIATDCYVATGRIGMAMRSLDDAMLYSRAHMNAPSRMQQMYLQARIQDALGHFREADKLFTTSAAGFDDLEMYKNAALVRLALIESTVQRGSWQKVVALCEEALAALRECRVHQEMAGRWRLLLESAKSRSLNNLLIHELRSYVFRHWHRASR